MPLIVENVLKSMGFNYMEATTTCIYFFYIIKINFFCYFIWVVEISDKFSHYSFQLIAIVGAYVILCDLMWQWIYF